MSHVETVSLKQPLSERERRALSQPAPDGAFEQVSLEQRIIEHFEVHGQVWTSASWRGLHAKQVKFVDCTLQSVDLREAVLRNVSFERCTLRGCRFGDARLAHCRFTGGLLQDCRARGGVWLDCVFDAVALQGVLLEETRIDGLRQRAGRMAGAEYSECVIRDWELSEVDISDAKFTLCDATTVSVRECQTDGLSVLGGSWLELSLEAGSLANLSLHEVDAQSVRIANNTSVRSVRINQSRLGSCVIWRCRAVFDLYLHASKLRRLALSHGRFTGWVTACEIGAGARIEDATLVGLFWDESRSTDLTFHGVTFEEAICARGAHFRGLKLEQASYEPGCVVLLDGATWEQSDRFQGDAR